MQEKASELLTLIENDNRDTWKYPGMYDICKLAIEYITLSGIEDATRSSEIISEIANVTI